MDGAQPRQLLHAACPLLSMDQKGGALVQARPSVQQLLQLPYVARYVECYAQQVVQLADAQGQGGLQGGLLPFQPAARWGSLECHLELLRDMWRPSMTHSTPLTTPCCQRAPDLQCSTASLMVDVLLGVECRRSSNDSRMSPRCISPVQATCNPDGQGLQCGCQASWSIC